MIMMLKQVSLRREKQLVLLLDNVPINLWIGNQVTLADGMIRVTKGLPVNGMEVLIQIIIV